MVGGIELRGLAKSPPNEKAADDRDRKTERGAVNRKTERGVVGAIGNVTEHPERNPERAKHGEAHGHVRTHVKRSTQRLGVGAVATLDEERSDDRGNHADECDSDREHEQLNGAYTAGFLGCEAARHRKGGQGNRSNDRAGVRLEEVGTHTGDVADVVADVVGDGGRVAGVVLGDTGFDLADEVGAHIGSLGVDAATDTGEEGDGGGAKAVGRDDLEGRVGLEPFNKDQVHQHQAGEGKAGNREAHHGATAERDREGLTRALLCCLCGAGVGHRRDGHAGVTGGRRQHRTYDVAHRGKRRDHDRDQEQHRYRECSDPGVLLLQERPGALLDFRH